jgi:heat shock protein HtpX
MFGNWFNTSRLMAAVVALFGRVGTAFGGAQDMQMRIVNPLAGDASAELFSTHPATRKRVARLLSTAH